MEFQVLLLSDGAVDQLDLDLAAREHSIRIHAWPVEQAPTLLNVYAGAVQAILVEADADRARRLQEALPDSLVLPISRCTPPGELFPASWRQVFAALRSAIIAAQESKPAQSPRVHPSLTGYTAFDIMRLARTGGDGTDLPAARRLLSLATLSPTCEVRFRYCLDENGRVRGYLVLIAEGRTSADAIAALSCFRRAALHLLVDRTSLAIPGRLSQRSFEAASRPLSGPGMALSVVPLLLEDYGSRRDCDGPPRLRRGTFVDFVARRATQTRNDLEAMSRELSYSELSSFMLRSHIASLARQSHALLCTYAVAAAAEPALPLDLAVRCAESAFGGSGQCEVGAANRDLHAAFTSFTPHATPAPLTIDEAARAFRFVGC